MNDNEQLRKSKLHKGVQRQQQQPELAVSPLAATQAALQRAKSDPNRMTTGDVTSLQRTVGNRAVANVLGRNSGVQRVANTIQRDEIKPVEEYGDLSIAKPWQLSKKLFSNRNALPSNKMKPSEDRGQVSDRLKVKKSEASERARMKNKPAPDELTQQTDDLGELYAHAQMLKDFYDHSLGKYARQTNGEYHAGPIKTLGRTMDKVSTDYSDKDTGQQRPERVKDLLRSSIVYEDARSLACGVRNMKTLAPGIKVRNVKNKFKKGEGYGDINMSLEIGDGFITELQMHLASFWALKHTKQDHDRYEDISILERAKEKNAGKFGPEKQSKLNQLKQQHSGSYDQAMQSEGDPEGAREVLKAIQEYST